MNAPLTLTPALALALAALASASGAQALPPPTEGDAPRIEVVECQRLLAAGKAVIIDTRALEAYNVSHIPGALSVPLETMKTRSEELKKGGKTVIAYCG